MYARTYICMYVLRNAYWSSDQRCAGLVLGSLTEVRGSIHVSLVHEWKAYLHVRTYVRMYACVSLVNEWKAYLAACIVDWTLWYVPSPCLHLASLCTLRVSASRTSSSDTYIVCVRVYGQG